jgi:surface polysaccharide O-acyltransferase-like enzyme
MKRLYDIDWLRVIIVLTIIPFHASIIFNQNPMSVMYVKDTRQVDSLAFFCSLLDRFHMVTLFLLAGMAIFYSMQKRSSKVFLKERFTKLFIPLLTGSILLNPITTYIWTINQGRKESFFHHYIGFFTKDVGEFDGLKGGYTPAHLWFVLYLFIFSLIGIPIFKYCISEKSKKLLDRLAIFFCKPYHLLILAIPYCVFYLVEIFDDKNPIAYFYVVLLGFLLATRENYMKALCGDKWVYLLLSIILYIINFNFGPSDNSGIAIEYLFGFISKMVKIVPAFMLIGFFHEYINKNTKVLNYLSKACFTVYVVHMLIVAGIGYLIIPLHINPYVEYIMIVTCSYLLSFGVYEIVKRNHLLALLFGANKLKKTHTI